LTVKISDQGGGIPKSKIDQVFEYHYTSAPEPLRSGSAAPMVGREISLTNVVPCRKNKANCFENLIVWRGTFCLHCTVILIFEVAAHSPATV